MFLVPLVLVAIGPIGPPAASATAAGDEVVRAHYQVDLVGRSRAVFALPPGPRTIRSFRWTPDPDAPDAWRSARLRLVWDGEEPEGAAVDVPLGRFVAPGGDTPADDGEPPPLVNLRPMPYRRASRLIIDAEGPVRGSIRVEAGPAGTALDDRGYLHAEVPAGEDAPSTPAPGGIPRGDAGPPVRYWYDRQPGPAPPPAGGRG